MAVSGVKLKTLPAITIDTAGIAKPLYPSSLMVYEVIIIALDNGNHYIGDSTVSSSNGAIFTQDGDYELSSPPKGPDQFDLSKVYINSDTAASEFRVLAWIRD